MSDIVLVTKSNRKIAEFAKLGLPFEAFQVDTDEPYVYGLFDDPSKLVIEQSKGKLAAVPFRVIAEHPNSVYIALDSVAYHKGILGKPKTIEEATERLKRFSGKAIGVYTGIRAEIPSKDIGRSRVVNSVLSIRDLSEMEISDYVANDPHALDTSLGFNPDHPMASDFIAGIEGPRDHVYGGVPLEELAKILRGFGK